MRVEARPMWKAEIDHKTAVWSGLDTEKDTEAACKRCPSSKRVTKPQYRDGYGEVRRRIRYIASIRSVDVYIYVQPFCYLLIIIYFGPTISQPIVKVLDLRF